MVAVGMAPSFSHLLRLLIMFVRCLGCGAVLDTPQLSFSLCGPVAGTMELDPVAGTKELGPVAGTKELGPVAWTKELGPVAGTKELGPVAGTKELGPVAGTKELGPVAGTKELGPVAGTKELGPVVVAAALWGEGGGGGGEKWKRKHICFHSDNMAVSVYLQIKDYYFSAVHGLITSSILLATALSIVSVCHVHMHILGADNGVADALSRDNMGFDLFSTSSGLARAHWGSLTCSFAH